MMKTLKSFALVVALLAVSAVSVFAQNAPVRTTLSAAIGTIASGQSTTISVTSTTGMTASTNSAQTFILVEREYMRVKSLSPFTVDRGQMGTLVSAHPNAATVIYGLVGQWSSNAGVVGNGAFLASSTRPSGACTRSASFILPVFNPVLGNAFDCLGGWWTPGVLPDEVTTLQRFCNMAESDAVSYASTGVVTSYAAGTIYVSSIYVPDTQWVTGVSMLQGITVGTTLVLGDLYDSGGALLARSSTAGITSGTASTFLDLPFGTALFLVGPSRYFIGSQGNGTTDAFRALGATANADGKFANARAGTFGTIGSITVPTAFTSVSAPIGCLITSGH